MTTFISVRVKSSRAAVNPAGPAPMIIAVSVISLTLRKSGYHDCYEIVAQTQSTELTAARHTQAASQRTVAKSAKLLTPEPNALGLRPPLTLTISSHLSKPALQAHLLARFGRAQSLTPTSSLSESLSVSVQTCSDVEVTVPCTADPIAVPVEAPANTLRRSAIKAVDSTFSDTNRAVSPR